MFAPYFEHTHRVLLGCFSGTLTSDDIARCDKAVMLMLGREGPIRGIMDFSDVEKIDIPIAQLTERARQPPIVTGQARIFVTTRLPALDFVELYAAAQREFTGVGPHIVGTRVEACRILGLASPRFEPLGLP